MKPQLAFEIGSARGRSASFIELALVENGSGKAFAIPHLPTAGNDLGSVDTHHEIRRNLADVGVAKVVEVVRRTSVEAAKTWQLPIDLVFIDGDHAYDGVKADWEAFSPFVTKFGSVVFHDTLWDRRPDPRYARAKMRVPAFVEELRAAGYPAITIDKDYGVSVVQPRPGGASLAPVR